MSLRTVGCKYRLNLLVGRVVLAFTCVSYHASKVECVEY